MDNQIRELGLETNEWVQTSISAIVTNNPPAFPMQSGSPLATLVGPDGIPRIYYGGVDRHIHELSLEKTGWAQADLSAIVVNSPPAVPMHIGSPLAALVDTDGISRVYYVGDGNEINELRVAGAGWAQSNISATVTNNPPAFPLKSGSSIAALVSTDGVPRIFYIGEDNQVRELRQERAGSGWVQDSISAIVTNTPPAFPPRENSPLATLDASDAILRVFYVGIDNQIRELRLEGTAWAQQSISAAVTNTPPAFPPRENSPLATLATQDSILRVFYVGIDNQVRELRLERTGWAQQSISAAVTNNPPAFPCEIGSPLFAYLSPNGIPRIVYRG